MAFVLESGCKGIAFFDTMQDFSKEKCNIYLVFNICLHIKPPFVGAHIVFITRERGDRLIRLMGLIRPIRLMGLIRLVELIRLIGLMGLIILIRLMGLIRLIS